MKKNKPESTSATVASIAAKLLRNPKTSKKVTRVKEIREAMELFLIDSAANTITCAYYCYIIANSFYDEKKFAESLKYYTLNNNYNTIKNWYSAMRIAEMYNNVKELNNKDSSAKWYLFTIKAMEHDSSAERDVRSRNSLDITYRETLKIYAGIIKNENGKEALEVYSKALKNGKGANIEIADIYRIGTGKVEKDWIKAKENYDKFISDESAYNSSYANYQLGQMYKTGGFGLEKNNKKSKLHFKAACKATKIYCE